MVLRSCLQLKCDIEDMLDKMDREKWSAEWRKKKEGGKDVASLITGKWSSKKNIFILSF